ncbi:trigger factor [Thioploca ingrica]|uniref:Trigger factor n=1 Tax=Thioploca ingrica TaxID=40754 RepID=A0A090AI41_9GAMM|nr:trigger factor [Thioploca ingrica]
MQVSVETTAALERRMTVGLSKERIEPEIQNRLRSLARKAKIKGFRPGKVPVRVVEQKYGHQVRQEVIGEVVQASFYEAIEQEKLRPVGEPTFAFNTDLKNLEEGLSYTATFEIYPEVLTLQADGLPVEKPLATVMETDIDTMLYRLRQQRQTWQEVDRAAQVDDRVIIDFVGTLNGAPFKGNEAQQVSLFLGQKNFVLPGLEDQLVGSNANEDREVDLTFPPDYTNLELAGQTVHFMIHVHSVAEPQLPPIDAEFAKAFGVEDGNVDTLRRDARTNMERELEYAIRGKIKQQLLEALLQANPVEVPQSLINEEAQRLLKTRQAAWQNQALTLEMFKEEALKRVKLGVLVSELVKKQTIQVQPEQVRQLIERIAFAYENPEEVVNSYYKDKQRLKEVESMVLEDQVVDWLLTRAQLTEKPTDFYTLMEQNSARAR